MRTNHHRLLKKRTAAGISRQAGYSLVEMAVVLAIIGAVAGAALTLGSAKHEASKIEITQERLDAIEQAIKLYAFSTGYLPCPAPGNALPGSTGYAVSQQCALSTPPAGITSTGAGTDTVWIGAIPTRSLNLPDSYMYDGWLNRFTYAVVKNLAVSPASFSNFATSITNGVITVQDFDGTQITDVNADTVVAYAIVSHGKNGTGAVNRAGVTTPCDAANLDGENCNGDTTLIDARITDSTTAANYYDDMVRWKTRNFMAPLKGEAMNAGDTIAFPYVADTGNNRVLRFNQSGSYLSELDSSACVSANFSAPEGVAVDSANNIYVADTGNGLVKKFDSSGACTEFDGDTQSADFNPSQLAVASDGKMYVVDPDDGRVIILNADGTYSAQFDGTGSSGTFNNPTGIVINGSEIFIADTGNGKIKKFYTDGSFAALDEDGTTGGGTAFTSPVGIAVDSTGNLYVADNALNSVQKFTSAGSYLDVFDDGGNLNSPEAVVIGGNDEVHILDSGNNLVKKFAADKTSLGTIDALDASAPAGLSSPLGLGMASQ